MTFYKKMLFSLILIALSALNVQAKESINTLKFESLSDFSRHTLPRQTPLLLYFFQPECPSCVRQKKDLACLPKNIKIVSIGVFGSRRELAQEARKFALEGLLLYGGKTAESFFNVRQTPTLIFYSSTGTEVQRADSWLECSSLKKLKIQ